ncbi:peroxidase [Pilimelia anulata]|uniref:Deferrochelatase n=1 Tax=Pilimelia anulata TaxID=53371 RepID=A0A8J3BEX9_9ACTN|nr:iron uptake transporter deferrochelatase/peroxidase subunit [Pilimelia anulata]GGK05731.1 peroxidase [Pilimelia anulata]
MSDAQPAGVRRRRLIAGAGVVGAVGVAAAGGALARDALATEHPSPAADAVPFHGAHQAGIVTAAQDRLHFAAFDVVTADRDKLVALLRDWTAAAERLAAGRDAGPAGAVGGRPEAPPDDTGEALGLPPAQLTLTVGFGATLFRDAAGRDRFGLAAREPAGLAPLPHFPGDRLEPAFSGGDLCVQACANDPQVAVHAIRNLARIGFGTVSLRWSQLGFGRTSATTRAQATPRNLMGFKDGTANLRAEDGALLDEHLWVQPADGPPWLAGGSYLVARRIRMMIETWDRTPLGEQETIIGRTKGSGAPLGGRDEFDRPDFAAAGGDGEPVIPAVAHVRLAHPDHNAGARMLRRGYHFVDGSDGLGRLDAGLFFLAFQRDPRRSFVPVQRALARADVLNEYIRHVGSAVFACPPGVREPGDFWGRALFG